MGKLLQPRDPGFQGPGPSDPPQSISVTELQSAGPLDTVVPRLGGTPESFWELFKILMPRSHPAQGMPMRRKFENHYARGCSLIPRTCLYSVDKTGLGWKKYVS